MLRRPSSADVVAVHPTVTLHLASGKFMSLIREHPTILVELYDLAVKRDDETQQRRRARGNERRARKTTSSFNRERRSERARQSVRATSDVAPRAATARAMSRAAAVAPRARRSGVHARANATRRGGSWWCSSSRRAVLRRASSRAPSGPRATCSRVDALHLLTDVAALGLALLAMRIAVRRPTARFTYRAAPRRAGRGDLQRAPGPRRDGAARRRGDLRICAVGGGPRADIMLYVAAWRARRERHQRVADPWRHRVAHGRARSRGPRPRQPRPRATITTTHHGHAHEHASDHGHAEARARSGPRRTATRSTCAARGFTSSGDALGSLAAAGGRRAIQFGFSPKVDPIASFVVAAILVYGGVPTAPGRGAHPARGRSRPPPGRRGARAPSLRTPRA